MLRKEEVLQNLTSARTVMSTIQAMTSKVYVYFVRVRPIGYMTLTVMGNYIITYLNRNTSEPQIVKYGFY